MADKGLVVALGLIVGIGHYHRTRDVRLRLHALQQQHFLSGVSENVLRAAHGYTTVTVVPTTGSITEPIVSRERSISASFQEKGRYLFKLNRQQGHALQAAATRSRVFLAQRRYDKKVFWYSGDG
jgi:hypothetical protein